MDLTLCEGHSAVKDACVAIVYLGVPASLPVRKIRTVCRANL